jgi:hypothetical protein
VPQMEIIEGGKTGKVQGKENEIRQYKGNDNNNNNNNLSGLNGVSSGVRIIKK